MTLKPIWTAVAWFPIAVLADEKAAVLPNSGAYVLQVLLGLAFVIGLIFFAGWLVRRSGNLGFLGNPSMRVVASMPLGAREKIVIVDIYGQQLLLGITPQTISTLHTFAEPVVDDSRQIAKNDFSERLKEILAKGVKS